MSFFNFILNLFTYLKVIDIASFVYDNILLSLAVIVFVYFVIAVSVGKWHNFKQLKIEMDVACRVNPVYIKLCQLEKQIEGLKK